MHFLRIVDYIYQYQELGAHFVRVGEEQPKNTTEPHCVSTLNSPSTVPGHEWASCYTTLHYTTPPAAVCSTATSTCTNLTVSYVPLLQHSNTCPPKDTYVMCHTLRKLECGCTANVPDEKTKEPVWCSTHGWTKVVKKDQKWAKTILLKSTKLTLVEAYTIATSTSTSKINMIATST